MNVAEVHIIPYFNTISFIYSFFSMLLVQVFSIILNNFYTFFFILGIQTLSNVHT